MTLGLLSRAAEEERLQVPASAAWMLEDLGIARGRQELFARQAPQVLRRLRESAIVESAVSSNRIEGVVVDPSRVATVVFGRRHLRDRDEREVRGYRDALAAVHRDAHRLAVSEASIRRLHAMCRPGTGDAGQYKAHDSHIVERRTDRSLRVRFRTVSAASTPAAMHELLVEWDRCQSTGVLSPLVAIAAFNLDFLCVHPFRDGNGRTSRLLMLLQCHRAHYDVGRYVSIERIIEENKERYYETLEQSSALWHEGRHDPWPFVAFFLFVLRAAYREFEDRVGQTRAPRGDKSDRVVAAIGQWNGPFRVADLQRACPGVSVDLIRKILKRMKAAGDLQCSGRGPLASWTRVKADVD